MSPNTLVVYVISADRKSRWAAEVQTSALTVESVHAFCSHTQQHFEKSSAQGSVSRDHMCTTQSRTTSLPAEINTLHCSEWLLYITDTCASHRIDCSVKFVYDPGPDQQSEKSNVHKYRGVKKKV